MLIEPQMSFRHDHTIDDAIASNWPEGCQGLRIAVVSDPHVGDIHMHRWRMERIRRQVAPFHPLV